MQYKIRNAELEDFSTIEEIYAQARSFMAQTGNPYQWGTTHPPRRQLERDIEDRKLYVILDGGNIRGVFYFYIGDDPTYQTIYEGAWHSDQPYGTIHRIAGSGGGILKAAVDYCSQKIGYLRIDTHRDNLVMQRAVQKAGFQPCGIIYIADGSPRLAYDRI